MQFLTQKQRDAKARRLYLGYALLSVLVLLATYIVVSTARGYELFDTDGVATQNGLLFVDSKPDGADVYINNVLESNKTNAKYVVPESTYDVKLTRQGYRDWTTKVLLGGGTVEFVTYPRLLPVSIRTEASSFVPALPTELQSRDKRWVLQSRDTSSFSLLDLDTPKQVTTITPTLPDVRLAIISAKAHEWAGDNRHILFRFVMEDQTIQYATVNRENLSEVVLLNQLFGLNGTEEVGFWDGKRDQFYIRSSDGSVSFRSSKDVNVQVSPAITEKTLQFIAIGGARAIYTVIQANTVVARHYSKDGSVPFANFNEDVKLEVKSFGFNRNDYLTITGKGLEKSYIYRNVEALAKKSESGRVAPFFTMPSSGTISDISRGNRFAMVKSGDVVQVYDIEQREYYKFTAPGVNPSLVGWLDDSRLYVLDSQKVLRICDFNGGNVQEIARNVETIPYVNADVRYVSFVLNDNGQLLSTRVNIFDI